MDNRRDDKRFFVIVCFLNCSAKKQKTSPAEQNEGTFRVLLLRLDGKTSSVSMISRKRLVQVSIRARR